MSKLAGATCCVLALILGYWITGSAIVGAQSASVGTPVPGGSITGGGGALKPHINQQSPPVTSASVDKYGAAGPVTDPADPNYEPNPDYAAEISFNSADYAQAEKTFEITAETSGVAPSVPVRWRASVEFDLEWHVRTINAPGQKDDTIYRTQSHVGSGAALHKVPLPDGEWNGYMGGGRCCFR